MLYKIRGAVSGFCFRRLWQLFQSSVAIVLDIYGLRFAYLWIALCISMDIQR